MRLQLLIVCITLNFGLRGQSDSNSIDSYPNFKEVAERYFSQQNFSRFIGLYNFSFEKNPEGWFIKYVPKNNKLIVRKDTIWLKNNTNWKIAAGNEETQYDFIQRYIQYEYYNYYHFPYYGYSSYIVDVIKLLETSPNLSADKTYSLINAYQLMASFTASNSFPKFVDQAAYVNANGNIDDYYFKMLSAYHDLKQINPHFNNGQLILEDLKSNSILDFAMMFISKGEHEKSKGLLNAVQYSPTAINYAKTLLNSAALNSILVVDDLMDFFPIYYIQQNNFRRDVIVVCKPLLETKWYRNHLYKKYDDEQLFSIPLKTINDSLIDVLSMEKMGITLSTTQLIKLVTNQPDSLKRWVDRGVQVLTIPSQVIHFSPDNNASQLVIKTKNTLTSGNLVIIDLIHTNGKSKAIHFTSGYVMKSIGINEQFIKKEGLLFSVKYADNLLNDYASMEIDAEISESIFEDIKWPVNNNYFKDLPKSKWLQNYQTFFTAMAKNYINQNNTLKAQEWIEKYTSTSFIKNAAANNNDFYVVHLMYELNKEDKAFIDLKVANLKTQYNTANVYEINPIRQEIIRYKELFDPLKEKHISDQLNSAFPDI